jgi:hypothetical protein
MPICIPLEIIIPYHGNTGTSSSSCGLPPDEITTCDNKATFDFLVDMPDKRVKAMFEMMLQDCDDDDYSIGSDYYSDDSSYASRCLPQDKAIFDDDSISLRKRSFSDKIESMMIANNKVECCKLVVPARRQNEDEHQCSKNNEEEASSYDDDERVFEDFIVPIKD